MDDITEEKISDLVTFLDNPWPWVNPRMALLYGRLRDRWEKLERAEAWLKPDIERRKESYKWRIINEIKQWLEDMKNENPWAHYEYEIVNIKSRTDWRTMQIWFRDVDINDKIKWRKSVEIEEKHNPEFFKEMMDRYAPSLNSKPF